MTAPPLPRRPGRWPVWLALAAGLVLAPAALAQAPKVQLLFSHKGDDTAPARLPLIRPNVQQELFVFAQNDDPQPREVTVELRSTGATVASKTVTVPADGKPHLVALGTPPVPPAKAELAEKAALSIRLLDDKKMPFGGETPLEVTRPSSYVSVPSAAYIPKSEKGPSQLAIKVQTRERFGGPRCRVELVLKPDRITGLTPSPIKKGIYGGYLSGTPNEFVSLVATDLPFAPGGGEGLVYVTVDGYERAFLIYLTFPREGAAPASGTLVTKEGALLEAPAFATTDKPLAVTVEVDNSPPGGRTQLDIGTQVLDIVGGQPVLTPGYTKVAEFRGDRKVKMLFNHNGPEGGLLFKPEVSDWTATFELGDVHGKSELRLQMFDNANTPLQFRNNRTSELVPEPEKERALVQPILLDGAKPQGVAFVEPPKGYKPGKPLILLATTADPVEDIVKVVFFTGKFLPDGKPPPDREDIPATLSDEKKKLWAAEMPVLRDQKGVLYVHVEFTKRTGATALATLKLEEDIPKDAAGALPPEPGSIFGKVLEGERPQKGMEVALREAADPKAEVKATATTDKNGDYEFKDLKPGNYRVSAAKSASMTKADKVVEVKAGEKKKQNLLLYRGPGLP